MNDLKIKLSNESLIQGLIINSIENEENKYNGSGEESLKFQKELELLKNNLQNMTEEKENYEKLFHEYRTRYEELEASYEKLFINNQDLMDTNKKLEFFMKYERKFSNSNPGINLGALGLSHSNITEEEDENEERGVLHVNIRPIKILKDHNHVRIPSKILRTKQVNKQEITSLDLNKKVSFNLEEGLDNTKEKKQIDHYRTISNCELASLNSSLCEAEINFNNEISFSTKLSRRAESKEIIELKGDEFQSTTNINSSNEENRNYVKITDSFEIGEGYSPIQKFIPIPKNRKAFEYTIDDCPDSVKHSRNFSELENNKNYPFHTINSGLDGIDPI